VTRDVIRGERERKLARRKGDPIGESANANPKVVFLPFAMARASLGRE